MLLDLKQPMRSISTGEPLPFRDGDDSRRNMTLKDALVQILETDTGPERTQMGAAQGPSKVQAIRLALDIAKADSEIELSDNDAELLEQIIARAGGIAIISGQAQMMLDQAKQDWLAAKNAKERADGG